MKKIATFLAVMLIAPLVSAQSSTCVDLQYDLYYRLTDAQTNGEVSILQRFLQRTGYLQSAPTGFFGTETRNAVRKFQSANGIKNTGEVGPLTRAKIKELTCGASSSTTTDQLSLGGPDIITQNLTISSPVVAGQELMFSASAQNQGDAYAGGASAWKVSDVTYSGIKSPYMNQISQTNDNFTFSPDGTKVFVVRAVSGPNADQRISEYRLSTPWDIRTASYVKYASVGNQSIYTESIVFKPDGTKLYLLGNEYMAGDGRNSVFQYSLSSAWDISTATYDNVSFSYGEQDKQALDMAFSPDGSKMYLSGNFTDRIYQYSLSTAWNIATASYDRKSYSFGAATEFSDGFTFKPDGTKMYLVNGFSSFAKGRIYQFSLSTPWDVSKASYDGITSSLAIVEGGQASYPEDLEFYPDGTHFYVMGINHETLYEHSLLTPFEARFCVDNANCLTTSVGALGANEKIAVLAPGASSPTVSRSWTAVDGAHTFSFCADVGAVVAESVESNNCSSMPFTVGSSASAGALPAASYSSLANALAALETALNMLITALGR